MPVVCFGSNKALLGFRAVAVDATLQFLGRGRQAFLEMTNLCNRVSKGRRTEVLCWIKTPRGMGWVEMLWLMRLGWGKEAKAGQWKQGKAKIDQCLGSWRSTGVVWQQPGTLERQHLGRHRGGTGHPRKNFTKTCNLGSTSWPPMASKLFTCSSMD